MATAGSRPTLAVKALAAARVETKTLDLAFAVKAVDRAKRTITGFASTPHIDQVKDTVDPEAARFGKPTDVDVYIGHDWRFGALPTGEPLVIRATPEGLYTETRIWETPRGDELLTVAEKRLAMGRPLGMSIGYPPDSVKATFERKEGETIRHIHEYELVEYSFTPVPANPHATTTGVKEGFKMGQGIKLAAKASDEGSDRPWSEVDKTELPKSAFAYAPGKNRSEWKLPHHEADGVVNRAAIRAALAALGGARTGKPMEVPSAARRHIEAHARALGIGEDNEKAAMVAYLTKALRQLTHTGVYADGDALRDHIATMSEADGHDMHDHLLRDHMADLREVDHGDSAAGVRRNVERHAREHGYRLDKSGEWVLDTKAGRVLSDDNREHLQEIHDRAHLMAKAAGFDLHIEPEDEDDEEDEDDDEDGEKSLTGLELELGLLQLEAAAATTAQI